MFVKFEPNEPQRRFLNDPRPNRWFCAGYGTGKTTLAVWECLVNALVHHPGYTGIVAAPTFPLLSQAFLAEFEKIIPRDIWRLSRDPKYGDQLIISAGNTKSTVLLRSSSVPWSNEGVNAAWLIYDEAAREKHKSSWDILSARVRQGYPGRQLTKTLTGPPMAKSHWTAKEFGTGPNGIFKGDFRNWHTETNSLIKARTCENIYLPKGYEEGLRNSPGATKAWVKQFLEAEFGSGELAIYESFDTQIHINSDLFFERQYSKVCVGVDWGFTHPGVMLVGGIDGLGNVYVFHEESHEKKIVADIPGGWVPIARNLSKLYKVQQFYCDPSAPNHMEVLQKGLYKGGQGIVYPANNDVGEGIREVQALLESTIQVSQGKLDARKTRQLFISQNCVKLIEGLEGYSRKKIATTGEITEHPLKQNDDEVDALRYLVKGLTDG